MVFQAFFTGFSRPFHAFVFFAIYSRFQLKHVGLMRDAAPRFTQTADSIIFYCFFFSAPFCRIKSVVKDCFTRQSPGKAISIPAAPDVQGNPAKSKPRLLRGGLGHDWCAGVGLGLRREAGW